MSKRTKKNTSKASKQGKARKIKTSDETTPKRVSLLAAAAHVLASSKEPLTTGQIYDEITKRELWASPAGKTPKSTLYAAMIREIGKKGEEARFRKTERGLFTASV